MNWQMIIDQSIFFFPFFFISMEILKDNWPVDVDYADAEMFVENSYCAPAAS